MKFIRVLQQVIVKILGDLANGRSLKDYSSKFLLIPSLKHWKEENEAPVQYTVRKTIIHSLLYPINYRMALVIGW